MKTLFFFICMIFLNACCKRPEVNTFAKSTYIDLVLKNKQGENLLSPNTSGYLNPNDFRVYYVKPNGKEEVFSSTSNAPRGFLINTNEGNGERYVRLSLYEGAQDDTTTITIIKWKESDEDTIKCSLSKSQGNIFISKYWFNGNLEYTAGTTKGSSWGSGLFERLSFIEK